MLPLMNYQRWLPILQYFDECGVDLCYEIHPGEEGAFLMVSHMNYF